MRRALSRSGWAALGASCRRGLRPGCWSSGRLSRRSAYTLEMAKSLIESNPAVMMGKPVVAGTRITVELILEKLGAGETIEQLLDAHPRLSREAVLAAKNFP